ncbi:MAG: hypothetical protein AABY64_13040 [Bdellovibrionota bacterium]
MKNKIFINSLLFTLGTAFFCISSQANEGNPITYCGDIDPKAPLGTICSPFGNSTDGTFIRVKNEEGALGWQDKGEGGKIWFDDIRKGVDHIEATDFCKQKKGQVLPSREDFSLAEKHGFQTIFRDLRVKTPRGFPWYWSSSFHPNYPGTFACAFNGNDRGPGYTYCRYGRDSKWSHSFVLCVSDK